MVRQIVPLLLVALFISACKRDDDKFKNRAIEPSINGTWAGNLRINGVDSAIQIILRQDNINVSGSYTADGGSTVLASAGTINGATTGPTFTLSVTGQAPACIQALQMGGANNGSQLSLNLIGTDCDGNTLNGESFLTKQ